jgi:hypothetical protein
VIERKNVRKVKRISSSISYYLEARKSIANVAERKAAIVSLDFKEAGYARCGWVEAEHHKLHP